MILSHKTLMARRAVLTGFVLLLGVLVALRPWSALPLLLFAPGLWWANWRSHIWLCFVLLFYFLLNINQLAYQPSSPLLWAECGLVVLLFTSAMLYCRWVKQVPVVHSLDVTS